jgi:hypothetical protein
MEAREEPVTSTDEVAYGARPEDERREGAPGAAEPPAGAAAPEAPAAEPGTSTVPAAEEPAGATRSPDVTTGEPAGAPDASAAGTAEPTPTSAGTAAAAPAGAGGAEARTTAPGGAEAAPAEGAMPLLSSTDTAEFERRWQEIQVGFVDEPRRCVEQADGLVAEVMKRLAEGFAEERRGLEGQWDRGDEVSTEDLRVALQRYRSFFNRLLSTPG